ncbi:MAG TPA: type II toxin-antitoxin system PemK/MazF family toxin [Thermoanaerobaculia bacterium]|nr:type II toxin-antitoxin system PemK/MazF family toxin [Thermoanaerobaculia bacterium]
MKLERGTIALVGLDPTAGQEQRGSRPCVIVSDPDVIADQRSGLVAVVPVRGVGRRGRRFRRSQAACGGGRVRGSNRGGIRRQARSQSSTLRPATRENSRTL